MRLYIPPWLLLLMCVSLTAGPALLPRAFAQENEEAKPVDPTAAVKEIFRTRCFECHGGSRIAGGIEILKREVLLDSGVLVPGDPDGSYLFDLITPESEDDYRMPPVEKAPPLSDAQIALVRRWIVADAPEFPDDVPQPEPSPGDRALEEVAGVPYVLEQLLNYVDSVPPSERRFLRFFSANHLLTAGATREELKLAQQALAKAVNHLSMQPQIVVPKVVDEPTATIFVIDIRQLGWHRQANEASGADGLKLNLFDLVLLEYPYSVVYQDSATFDRLVDDYLENAGMILPIPFVRVDWFVSTATRSPLYEDLLQLPFELDELEAKLGVDTAENIEHTIARRAGMVTSGVSRNNRVVERHPARNGAYWKSYDFASSRGPENMFIDPVDLRPSGGEMIFNLPNGLQGYLITDAQGRRIDEAPTGIVTDRIASDKVVRNGLSCIRCHDRGMKRFTDSVREAMQTLPGSSVVDKRRVLDLYAPQEEMNAFLDQDAERFAAAIEAALGEATQTDPLDPVSVRYLDSPLQMIQVAAELGMADTDGLAAVLRTPQFARLGLTALLSGGVVRRDTWEEYFDRMVSQLGLGQPIVPLDGLTRPDYFDAADAELVTVKTNKPSNIFAPGEEMFVTVANNAQRSMFIEMIGTSVEGRKVILIPAGASVAMGESLRFPQDGSITIKPKLGVEEITVLAAPAEFPAGEVLQGREMRDRVVHRFYQLQRDGRSFELENEPTEIIKKTIRIETR